MPRLGTPRPVGGAKMIDTADHENTEGRDRLSRLSEASPRISKSLDLDTVLQEVDGARALTGSHGRGRPQVSEGRRILSPDLRFAISEGLLQHTSCLTDGALSDQGAVPGTRS